MPSAHGDESVVRAEGTAAMSTPSRLLVGAWVVALGIGCRTPRAVEPTQPPPPPDAATSPTADAGLPPDAVTPSDATVEDVPAPLAAQRRVLRACPAPAGTPAIQPGLDAYDDAAGPWKPAVRRTITDLPAPVAAACAAMDTRRTTALARLGANAPDTADDPHVEAVGRCFHAGRGAWVLEPGAARIRSGRDLGDQPMRWVEFATTLAFVQSDGRVLRMRGARPRAWWSVFHDFDGDGVAEAGLRLRGGDAMPSDGSATLYTMRDGAIVAYARGEGVDASVPVDIDADGRPDFLANSPFTTPNTCGPSVFYGVPEVVHALADGGFSRDDAVPREWMRQRCAGVTTAAVDHVLEAGPPYREIVGRIGCLRYLGVTAEALQRALDAQWPVGSDDHCWSREAVVSSLRSARVPFQVASCATDPGT